MLKGVKEKMRKRDEKRVKFGLALSFDASRICDIGGLNWFCVIG